MSILIVEDNVISARMLEGILKHHQLPTYTARNGVQALQILQEHNDVRLILLDLMMPEMDGFQFLDERNAQPQLKSIPVIVMTALADNETVRRVIMKGCKHYVVKPIREDQLIPKIKELMPTAPSTENQILRGRFEVMEEMGLDEQGYDELFTAFHDQTRKLISEMDSLGEGTFPKQALHAFSEDALAICGANTSKRLEALSEIAAVPDTRNYLSHLLHALDNAHERRQRIRARMNGQE